MLKIWEFIKKYYHFLFFIVIIILSFFLFQTCSTLKEERKQRELDGIIYEQNRLASTDSVTKVWNNKLKMWEYSKASYVLEYDNLKNYNKNLQDTIKKLKGKVSSLIESQSTIQLGKVIVGNKLITLTDSYHYGLRFNSTYQDAGLKQIISGESRFYAEPDVNTSRTVHLKGDSTILDTNFTTIKVLYGFRELDKQFQVFALSPSKKVIFEDITGGYFIDKQPEYVLPKPKKWGFGPYIGVGLNTDLNASNPGFGWSIGFSLHYSIWQWRMPWEKK